VASDQDAVSEILDRVVPLGGAGDLHDGTPMHPCLDLAIQAVSIEESVDLGCGQALHATVAEDCFVVVMTSPPLLKDTDHPLLGPSLQGAAHGVQAESLFLGTDGLTVAFHLLLVPTGGRCHFLRTTVVEGKRFD